ncbi:hypothetical protein ABL849_17480 [Variovorax sp. 375MFSha3.1]|uniref:hypothetical protein n=1 Tax=Variovorax sp. 375MFSha3.1 TaxID=3158364 RepID=UPI003AAB71CE
MALVDPIVQADLSIEKRFFHGVDLNNDILVNNLRVSRGRLVTADLMGMTDPGIAATHRPIPEIPIEEIAEGMLTGNLLAPRSATYTIPASILKTGQEIVDGRGRPWPITDGRKARIVDTAAIEVAFEAGRRRFAPSAPSRMSCIWLAEGNEAGRNVIASMMRGARICSVRVSLCLGIKVADAGWYDDYTSVPTESYIEKYWTGIEHPRHSLPEYLVEGVIEFTDEKDLEDIMRNGRMFGPA